MPPSKSSRARRGSSPPRSPAQTRQTRSQSVEAANVRRDGRGKSVNSEKSNSNNGRPASRDLAAVDEDAEYDDDDANNGFPPEEELEDEQYSGENQEVLTARQNNAFLQQEQLLQRGTMQEDEEIDLGGDPQSFADMLQAQAQAQAEHEQQQQHSARAGSRPVANMNVQSEVNKLAGVDFGMPLDPVVTSTWQSGIQVQNKENRHPSAPRRLIDPHPQATKEVWNSQDYLQTQPRVETSQKRAHPGSSRHQATHEEEDEESEDEVFQRDSRPIDYSRRHTIQSANPSKRARHEGSSHQREEQFRQREESLRLREESIRQRELSQPMPSFARDAAVVDNLPLPQIAASQAKVIVQHMTQGPRKVQVRRPWSRSDEDLLIQHIGEYGCSWSELEKIGGYERDFGNMQVDLKDKARNLKTAFLKAGGPRTVLPYNFHQVRLGKKEIAAVHKVYPEYDQELELEEALLNQ